MPEVLVDTSAAVIYTPGGKERVTIINMGSNAIELSWGNVPALTYGTGFPVAATTGTYTSAGGSGGGKALYAITTSAKQSAQSGTRVLVEPLYS